MSVPDPGGDASECGLSLPPPRWRARIDARPSQRVRLKALARSRSLLDAAFELLVEVGSEFTVQDLVERAQSSLRAFYEYFESKEGLFLAMFEEANRLSLRRQLEAAEEAGEDPVARLRAFVLSRWKLLETGNPALSRALVVYHLRLAEVRPAELSAVLKPTYEVLLQLVEQCRSAGRLRADLSDSVCASLLLQTSLASIQALVLDLDYGGRKLAGEETWAVLESGLFGES